MTSKEIIEKGDKKRVKVFEDNMKGDDSKEALRIIKKNKLYLQLQNIFVFHLVKWM